MANIADPGGFILEHRVTQPFGVREAGAPTGTHTGVDFAMNHGTPVPAVHGGVVTFAGWSPDGRSGIAVIIAASEGDEWWYAHLDRVATRAGVSVARGEVIGFAGATGLATGPHLHLEWRSPPDTPIDPYEEVVMLSQETQDTIRAIVKDEITRAGASIERKIDSGFNATMPVMFRRLARWLKLGQPRDPAGDPRTTPPSPYPDDTAPIV